MDISLIERIHNNRCDSNNADANKLIEEYGSTRFFQDYYTYLSDLGEYTEELAYELTQVIVSYLRYLDNKELPPMAPQCNIIGYEQNFQATRISLLVPRHDHKAFLRQLSIGESEGYQSETGKMIMHVLNEECEATL